MAGIADTLDLVDSVIRLRRAEKVSRAAADVEPVRRRLEAQLGLTFSRSRASKALGVSQTALDRWVGTGQIPVVVTPRGRREVPRQVVIELRESLDRLKRKRGIRHPLSVALAERRGTAGLLGSLPLRLSGEQPAVAHDTAERRSRAFHQAIAERLDSRLAGDARERVDRLTAEGHMHPTYAERWREVLALPVDRIAEVIVADSHAARDLRQSSPFAGVLNEHERRRIIESFR